jgi:LPS-assembly protein
MDNPFYKPPLLHPIALPDLNPRPMHLPMPDLSRSASRAARWGAWPLALLLAGPVLAQDAGAEPPLQLKSSPLLQEQMPAAQRSSLPTFLFGDYLSGRPDLDMVLQGQAEFRRGETVIRADRLEYEQPDDLARARGNVRVNRAGNVYEGPLLELKVDAFEGFFNQPSYQFLSNGAHGQAERVDFLDDKRAIIRNASFTTCQREPGPSWLPGWLLRAGTIRIDTEDEVGQAEDAQLSFKGAPLLSLSSVSFALSDKRKSGLLSPTLGVDSISGTELTQPYYWNIAPNRDLTLYPTLMSKRGLNLGSEFRYLEPGYTGRLRADYMPGDTLRERSRWGLAYQHQGTLQTGVPEVGALGLNLNLNRVSDDDYWRDFSRATAPLNQRLLPSSGALTWGRGFFSTSLSMLKWQTVQDVNAPIVPPYDRLPQLTARYFQLDAGGGFDFSVDGDHTQFQADRTLIGRLTGQTNPQPNAQRNVMLAQISRPWLGAAGFITPKLQLHSTAYQFETPLAVNSATTASRVVPTFSLDSGLVFEREAGYFGRDFVQTLEPRLFYVYTPFRDQSYLPNYDSGANDFNFASIYTENSFVGHDRIADNNLLTAGLSTRFLDPLTGAEAARLGIAQRYRFSDRNVTLPCVGTVPAASCEPARERLSDLLLGASLNLDSRWVLDSMVQYNPTTEQSVRSTVGARYHPGSYRVINTAYRFQRDASEQLDLGWQWPINDLWGDKGQDLGAGQGQGPGRWYSVGRLNYSLKDGKLVDAILGFEYDAGCWLGRVVVERLQTGLVSANERLMFQLEFVGFSRLGIDPLSTLKNNIPRYQYLREPIGSPSRFSNYD